jgi:o-succinylbenzoate---CoA ligase
MMEYTHKSLWINGRLVELADINNGQAIHLTEFEKNTFNFIQAWNQGVEDFILQTSGSTGTPKEIRVTRTQMYASARMTQEALGLERNSTALICIDTKYIGGKMMIVRSLVVGMKMIIMDPVSDPLEHFPSDQVINFSAWVPLQLKTVLGSKHPHLLNNIEKIIIGGAPLDDVTINQLQHYSTTFFATYAMTETISHVALRVLNGLSKQPYFVALPGVRLSVDGRNCLVITTPFLEEPVITNDLVDLKSTNEFEWLGRWDNIINTGGVKISPEKIEAAIGSIFKNHKVENRFFVSSIPDERLGQRLILVVEGTEIPPSKLRSIIDEIFTTVPRFETPKELFFTPRFSLTSTGKINRVKSMKTMISKGSFNSLKF